MGSAANGINNIQNVTGGSGNDILIGDGAANVLIGGGGNNVLSGAGGDDSLTGGTGRDILLGGTGADVLTAGVGEALLVGNATSYDTNVAALSALMAEWGRTDANYLTRIGHLTSSSGGRNGTFLLTSSTITDDLAVDVLNNGGIGTGPVWYIAQSNDTVPALRTINGVLERRTTL
jgi:Ca2+-binding RTX toxin-like protein